MAATRNPKENRSWKLCGQGGDNEPAEAVSPTSARPNNGDTEAGQPKRGMPRNVAKVAAPSNKNPRARPSEGGNSASNDNGSLAGCGDAEKMKHALPTG